MRLCYSGRSAPSAFSIAEVDSDITPVRSDHGEINWGRANANTQLNPDISNVTNKRRMRELFRENDVPMPRLIPVEDVSRMFGVFGHIVIGRPDTHTRGRGFWKINSLESFNRALRGTRKKRPATHFMEYIDAPREYRVHVFKGKSIRISEKLHCTTGLTAHGDYTTAKPQHNVDHVRTAAKKAVAAVGLDFGAVDVLANDTECWVLEVNSAPGLGGSMPRLYAETFKRWERGEFDV